MLKIMPKFRITTLGCKVNQCESDGIATQLKACEWSPALENEPSEICIINTCTVTQKASMQSRQAVRQAIRLNPSARILVTGCYAQTEPQAIAKIPGVDDIIGNADKHSICNMILRQVNPAIDQSPMDCKNASFGPDSKFVTGQMADRRTRPFLKIQDGCNAFCAYCIVPYARGPSCSLPVDKVLAGIQALSNSGYREIVLTGIHLGHYGNDLIPKRCLSELLSRIDDFNLIPRVRLTSIEPLELSDAIIKQVAGSKRFCRHFHIPLQSGDDDILQKMKRPYTAKDFKELVIEIHDQIPEAAIGVDTLVGFPGESDSAFENTYALVEQLPISYLHVFPFSSRPGTPAAKYPHKIPPQVIKDRCKRMRLLGEFKRAEFYTQFVGQNMVALIETTRHRSTGLLKGLTSNYIPILIDASDDYQNKLVTIKAQELMDDALVGTLLT